VAISDRDLLDASRRLTRSTPDDVLREMTAAFDDVRATVAETAARWAEVLPRVDAARARSAALARQSIALDAREEVPPVDDLARLAAVDPLAFDMDLLTEREERLEALATRLEAAARLRDGLVPLLEGARRDLAAAQAASRQAAAEAVAVSAVVADDRPDLPTGGELTNALEPIAALAAAGAWADAADRLAAWQADLDTMRARVTASTSASRALLATRDELRGRLRAYEAKAEHLGRLEDRTVAAAKRRAAEALTRPPVDLAVAGALVAEYQEVVNAAGERR